MAGQGRSGWNRPETGERTLCRVQGEKELVLPSCVSLHAVGLPGGSLGFDVSNQSDIAFNRPFLRCAPAKGIVNACVAGEPHAENQGNERGRLARGIVRRVIFRYDSQPYVVLAFLCSARRFSALLRAPI